MRLSLTTSQSHLQVEAAVKRQPASRMFLEAERKLPTAKGVGGANWA